MMVAQRPKHAVHSDSVNKVKKVQDKAISVTGTEGP
jgi:hypothetical protein